MGGKRLRSSSYVKWDYGIARWARQPEESQGRDRSEADTAEVKQGSGSDGGIDAIYILMNGRLVRSPEDAERRKKCLP
jgi:hypothetical protein